VVPVVDDFAEEQMKKRKRKNEIDFTKLFTEFMRITT